MMELIFYYLRPAVINHYDCSTNNIYLMVHGRRTSGSTTFCYRATRLLRSVHLARSARIGFDTTQSDYWRLRPRVITSRIGSRCTFDFGVVDCSRVQGQNNKRKSTINRLKKIQWTLLLHSWVATGKQQGFYNCLNLKQLTLPMVSHRLIRIDPVLDQSVHVHFNYFKQKIFS